MNYISQTIEGVVINGQFFPSNWLIAQGFPPLDEGIKSFFCANDRASCSTGNNQLPAKFTSDEERQAFLDYWVDRLPELLAKYQAELEPEINASEAIVDVEGQPV